jgi:hypothetical protein
MSQLVLCQRMMKKGDDVAGDDDDEVRTSVSQNRVAATLCTEELFLRTLSTYQPGKMWGEGKHTQGTWSSPSWVLTPQVRGVFT